MENKKNIPLRKCVVSGEKLPKKELVRVVRTPEGEVIVDLTPSTIASMVNLNILKP